MSKVEREEWFLKASTIRAVPASPILFPLRSSASNDLIFFRATERCSAPESVMLFSLSPSNVKDLHVFKTSAKADVPRSQISFPERSSLDRARWPTRASAIKHAPLSPIEFPTRIAVRTGLNDDTTEMIHTFEAQLLQRGASGDGIRNVLCPNLGDFVAYWIQEKE